MRITIDDDIDHDPRIMTLKCIVGDANALGYLIGAYRVATKYYVPDRKPIPSKLFKLIPWAQPLIDSGVAELTDDGQGIFIIQSEEQFGWVIAKHESGKKGGLAKASKALANSGELVANASEPVAEVSETYPLAPAPAPVPVLAPVILKKEIQETEIQAVADAPALPAFPKKSKFTDLTRAKMRAFIAAYAKGYEEKYNGKPEGIRDKALIGKLGHWIESVSEVRSVSLVEVYLQISYRPFDENYHDLWQFFRHLNRIGIALDTGKDSNSTDWSKVFAGTP